MGMGVGVGVVAFCIFVLFGCYTYRKLQQGKKRDIQRKEYLDYDDMSYGFSSKGSSFNGQSRRSRYSRNSNMSGDEYNQRQFRKLLDGIEEGSESDSSSNSSSSSSDSSSEGGSDSRSSSSSSSSSSEGDQSRLKITDAQAPLSPVSTGNTPASMSASQDTSQSQSSASMFASQDMSQSQYSASMSTRSHSRASASMATRSLSQASASKVTSEGRSQTSASMATSEGRSRSQYSATSGSQRTEDKSYASENRSFGFSMASESMSRSHASRSQSSYGSSIEEDEYMQLVRRVAENDPTLKLIALDNKEVIGCHDDGERLWSALVNNQFVECLSLRNSNITDAQISSLSMALMDNRSVSRLWLENNDITSDGAEYLMSALESNARINEVRLEGNLYIDENLLNDIESILDGASAGTNDEDNLGFIVDQIFNNDPSLRELNLSEMFIGSRSDALFDALSGNTYVKALDLSSNEIDDDCVSSFSIALMENTSIQHINLSNNYLTSEGAECKYLHPVYFLLFFVIR